MTMPVYFALRMAKTLTLYTCIVVKKKNKTTGMTIVLLHILWLYNYTSWVPTFAQITKPSRVSFILVIYYPFL